jgi:hypothetical protein
VFQVAEYLPSKHKALSSNPSTSKNQNSAFQNMLLLREWKKSNYTGENIL